MDITQHIREAGTAALKALYRQDLPPEKLQVNETKPEFEGDYTLVMFPLKSLTGENPEALGQRLGAYMTEHFSDLFDSYNVIKGFLNLGVRDRYWLEFLDAGRINGPGPGDGRKVMVEYSSPNTNKPLHLGHLRNNFLGYAIAEILKANGYEVVRANLINDRGIHICKSMVAWQDFGDGASPESTGVKGDHLVGDFYVRYNDVYLAEVAQLKASGMDEEHAKKEAPILKQAQEMLLRWEQGDKETRELWSRMNQWVYTGFEETYQRMGVAFDKWYYESDTYLLGKGIVEEGLGKGVFFRKPDGSVWVDLSAEGLGEKLLLRADGTSVYMTQDLGTAQLKYDDFHADRSIYVIGDEQNYHMSVLKLILHKLDKPYAAGIHHLSYGMVELPYGRMKSREGTVVDADDLIDEMVATAGEHTRELGKVADFSEQELQELYEILGLGAMKFYLLRVDPKRKMVFNPEESIDFHGFTGPFVQYTYARIRSILRKEAGPATSPGLYEEPLLPLEKALLRQAEQYSMALEAAGKELDPSIIATYAFGLAKLFNTFYTAHSVRDAESPGKKQLRLQLCRLVSDTLRHALALLGIGVPERM